MKKIGFIISFFILSVVTAHAADADEYKKLISYLDLSLPQLSVVKECAEAGDYETAVWELVDYYSKRQAPVWSEMPRKPGNSTTYNTTDADNIRNLMFDFNGTLISAANSDGSVNWHLKPEGQKEWMWAFNRQFQFVNLSRAYVNTGKIIYAEAFEKQFNDWYVNNPKPAFLDTDGTWRTLEAGIRIGSSMISYFNNFVMSNDISLLTKTRILLSLHEHGEYLSEYCGTNNWMILESKGFYSLVYMFPEFKASGKWKNIIFDRLDGEFSNQFLDDGWQHELTPNYHIECVKSIYAIWDMAKKNGDHLPYESKLVKAYTSAQAIMGAGMFILPLNDTHSVNQSDFMYQAAAVSEITDAGLTEGFLSSATGGLYGERSTVPKSEFYENAGYIVMRDRSDKKEVSAFFEAGASGIGGHGWMSRDKLQFTLTAFDRDLLIDTGGSTTYGQDPLSRYTYTTPAHNTVTIDGYDQIRRKSDNFTPGTETKLLKSANLEYAQGIYDEKYDETKLIDVTHKRRIAFIKSEYFVVRDELSGTGSHTARQYWNFAPGKYVLDDSTGIVRTDFEDGNNVMVIPATFNEYESNCGRTSPMLGWTSEGIETLNFCYKQDFTDAGQMETIILPYQGRIAPDITVSRENGKIKIKYKDFTDIVSFSGEDVSVERTYDDGRALQMDFGTQPGSKEETKAYPVIPCSGIIQAEWSGFEQNGIQYHYDSQAKNYGTAVFEAGTHQILRTAYGINSLKIRAKGQGTLKINEKSVEINSEDFQDYVIFGISGGKILINGMQGTVIVDSYQFNGSGKDINMHAVRQRLPSSAAELIFAQSAADIRTVSAEFMPIRSLTAVHKSYFGFKIGAYSVRYNASDKVMELLYNDSVIASEPCYLHYGKWYKLSLGIGPGKMTIYVDGIALISSNISISGKETGIVSSYIDMYVDNLIINGAADDFEGGTVGMVPNRLAGRGGKWLVEGIENQYGDMEIICSADTVLPGTNVTLLLNNANGAKLIRNGREVEYEDNTYVFAAPPGMTIFCLKTAESVSKPVEITGRCDTYTKAVYLREDFAKNSLDSRWKYTPDFVPVNGKWHLSGLKSQQTEVYNNLASAAKDKVSLECDFIPDGNSSEIKLFICRDSSNRELHTIKLAAGGNIVDSVTNEKLGCYVSGALNRIRVDVDIKGGTYTVYNNGALISADRKINSAFSDIIRIYPALIWNGSTGVYISNFRLSALSDLTNEIKVQKVVGGSTVFSEKFRFMNDSLYWAQYEKGALESLDILSNADTVHISDMPVRLFDWNEMTPFSQAAEYYFTLSPGFTGKDYFYQDFDGYAGGLPGTRWGGNADYLSPADGAVFARANPSGMSELYYNCLDCLQGKVAVAADYTAETDQGRISLFTIRDADGREMQLIEYGADGKIYDYDGAVIGHYTAGAENKIRVEIDTVNRVFSVWVDNNLCAEDIKLTGNASGIKRIYLVKIYKGGSGITIDDFTVSKIDG